MPWPLKSISKNPLTIKLTNVKQRFRKIFLNFLSHILILSHIHKGFKSRSKTNAQYDFRFAAVASPSDYFPNPTVHKLSTAQFLFLTL